MNLRRFAEETSLGFSYGAIERFSKHMPRGFSEGFLEHCQTTTLENTQQKFLEELLDGTQYEVWRIT